MFTYKQNMFPTDVFRIILTFVGSNLPYIKINKQIYSELKFEKLVKTITGDITRCTRFRETSKYAERLELFNSAFNGTYNKSIQFDNLKSLSIEGFYITKINKYFLEAPLRISNIRDLKLDLSGKDMNIKYLKGLLKLQKLTNLNLNLRKKIITEREINVLNGLTTLQSLTLTLMECIFNNNEIENLYINSLETLNLYLTHAVVNPGISLKNVGNMNIKNLTIDLSGVGISCLANMYKLQLTSLCIIAKHSIFASHGLGVLGGFAQTKSLKYVTIILDANTYINLTYLTFIRNLPNLIELNLSFNYCKHLHFRDIIFWLLKDLPTARITLSAIQCSIYDKDVSAICELVENEKLRTLYMHLQHNYITYGYIRVVESFLNSNINSTLNLFGLENNYINQIYQLIQDSKKNNVSIYY